MCAHPSWSHCSRVFVLMCVCLAALRSPPYPWHTKRQSLISWSAVPETLSQINWSTKGNSGPCIVFSIFFFLFYFNFFLIERTLTPSVSVCLSCLSNDRISLLWCVPRSYAMRFANFCYHQNPKTLPSLYLNVRTIFFACCSLSLSLALLF